MKQLGRRPWVYREPDLSQAEFEKLVEELSDQTGLSRLVTRVCIQRGYRDIESVKHYLTPELKDLKDPYTIKDCDLAVERFIQARTAGERIRVFGDYDVDGTSGGALLSWVLKDFLKGTSTEFDVEQPDRFKDGYGLGVPAVDRAAESGVKLLITVDCGITSFAAIDRAREHGIDVIVIDHHQVDPERGLPKAYAVMDPQREDCESGLKELCGCGLAFYFARAVRKRGMDLGWWAEGQAPNLKQHLDLVVLATAADCVPLVRDNHILVRHGLPVLKNSQKPGMKALLDVSGLSSRELTPSHLGFVLGPRINASGRLSSASLSLELLTTTDRAKATDLAFQIENINKERMAIQNLIWDDVKKLVEEKIKLGEFKHAIVVGDASWHEGVVGIVASRVCEHFGKPSIVLSIKDGHAKGSVRTFAGKDVLHALRGCAKYLKTFGGHKHAAGLSLNEADIPLFAHSFDEAVSQVDEDREERPLYLECDADVSELSQMKTLQEIERLGPFGPGNPEPVFVVEAQSSEMKVIKERHLKFELFEKGSPGLSAIWFHGIDHFSEEMTMRASGKWAGVPEINRFRGAAKPVFRIRDLEKKSE